MSSSLLLSFPLTVWQAADILDMSSDEVVDLVRASLLPAYLPSRGMVDEKPRLRFAPEDVEDVAVALADERSAQSRSGVVEHHMVSRVLRDWLGRRAATSRHAVARQECRPWSALIRGVGLRAHIKAEWLKEDLEVASTNSPHPRAARVRLPSGLTETLEALGAVRVRGVRDDDGTQRWDWWWRLPSSLWSEHGSDVEDLPVFGSPLFGGAAALRRDAAGEFVADDELKG